MTTTAPIRYKTKVTMSQEELEKLLGRLLTDDQLRQRAATQLERVCNEEGFLLTPDELHNIKPEDIVRLTMVSSWLEKGIKRRPRKSNTCSTDQ